MSPERQAELEARLSRLSRQRDLAKEAVRALSRQINIVQTQLRARALRAPKRKLVPYAGATQCKYASTTKTP